MHQLEILMVRVRLRADNTRGAIPWEGLPEQAKLEVLRNLVEMFCAHLERRATGEVDDE